MKQIYLRDVSSIEDNTPLFRKERTVWVKGVEGPAGYFYIYLSNKQIEQEFLTAVQNAMMQA